MTQRPANPRSKPKAQGPGAVRVTQTAKTVILQIPVKTSKQGKRPGPTPPERADHLKQFRFQPGQSGNPKGSSQRAVRLSDAYKRVLEEVIVDEDTGDSISGAELIARGQRHAAIRGFTPAAKELREATEGKLPETVNVKGTLGHVIAQAGEDELDRLIAELGGQLQQLPDEEQAG